MFDLSVWESSLVGVNVILYSGLALQLARMRDTGQQRAQTISDAFAILGRELKRSVPTIPPGYTWREGIEQARKMKLNVDWSKVIKATDAYESYRYGCAEEVNSDYAEVLTLARELRRTR